MVQDPRKLQNDATLLVETLRCLPTLAWIWAQYMKKMKWCLQETNVVFIQENISFDMRVQPSSLKNQYEV
jgi:hypothetical protein